MSTRYSDPKETWWEIFAIAIIVGFLLAFFFWPVKAHGQEEPMPQEDWQIQGYAPPNIFEPDPKIPIEESFDRAINKVMAGLGVALMDQIMAPYDEWIADEGRLVKLPEKGQDPQWYLLRIKPGRKYDGICIDFRFSIKLTKNTWKGMWQYTHELRTEVVQSLARYLAQLWRGDPDLCGSIEREEFRATLRHPDPHLYHMMDAESAVIVEEVR